MTQDERWLSRYNEVKNFIESNHRNPSKYYDEEKLMVRIRGTGTFIHNIFPHICSNKSRKWVA